jgi:hypothetical protein
MSARRRTVELTEQQIVFLRSCLEWTAEQLRTVPGGPQAQDPAFGANALTAIADIESALADAQDIG